MLPGDEEHNISKIIRFSALIISFIWIATDGGNAFPAILWVVGIAFAVSIIFDMKASKRRDDLNRKIRETFPERIRKPSWEWEKTGDPDLDAWYDRIK